MTALTNAASPKPVRGAAPMTVAPCATGSVIALACRLQGKSLDSNAQPIRSIRQTRVFSMTASGNCSNVIVHDARAMRSASASLDAATIGLATVLDIVPSQENGKRREIRRARGLARRPSSR
jgi:hypothetical protein